MNTIVVNCGDYWPLPGAKIVPELVDGEAVTSAYYDDDRYVIQVCGDHPWAGDNWYVDEPDYGVVARHRRYSPREYGGHSYVAKEFLYVQLPGSDVVRRMQDVANAARAAYADARRNEEEALAWDAELRALWAGVWE